MKLPWSKPETKSGQSLIALSHLPIADWGRTDPAALVKDGYSGNAVAYRCVRMIAEAAASIAFVASDERVQSLLVEPSPEEAGRTLLERLYTDLQITGNAWMEAVTVTGEDRRAGTARNGIWLRNTHLPANQIAAIVGQRDARRIAAAFSFPTLHLTDCARGRDVG